MKNNSMDMDPGRGSSSEDPNNGEEEEFFVNSEDGLRFDAMDVANNMHNEARDRLQIQLLNGEWEDLGVNLDELIDEDFPTNLIITGFSPEFFEQDEMKERLEGLFQLYGDATFHYFKSFKRVRVTYTSAASAIQARIKMHMSELGDNVLKCYFGQNPVVKRDKEDGLLHPPTPDKQFLISPPASPPVDWEPCPESHPNINYDLVSALVKLSPGEAHELHKPEKEWHPSIVVHIAGDEEEESQDDPLDLLKPKTIKITQTRRPEV